MTCQWLFHNAQTAKVGCQQRYWYVTADYKFCPFCGKTIALEWKHI